jgi:cysteine-rich repeat protein
VVATTTTLPSPCGNGTLDAGEQCDDGNTLSGDGCGATCQDEATQVSEVEPNNFAAQANAVAALPVSVLAQIRPRTDMDYFAFTVTAGTRLRLQTFDASGVTCDAVDTYLELCDTDGVTALASSDDGGGGTCSLIAERSLSQAGTYFARVLSANGSSIPSYRLRISRLP